MNKNRWTRYGRVLFLASLLCLTGCWDKVELENRGFVVSMGIDKYKGEAGKKADARRYTISLSLPNTEAMAAPGGKEESRSVKKADHQTVAAAWGQMDSHSGQKLYFGQTKVAVWGKEVLEDESLFREAVDALERNPEISRKIIVLSTEENAEKALNAKATGEPFMGLFVSKYFQNKNRPGATFRLDLEELAEQLARGGAVIPKIREENQEIKLEGAAVMKGYKLAGWLTDRQTRGYLWVQGKRSGALLPADFHGEHLTLRVDKSRAKIRFYEEGAQTKCLVEIHAEGALEESGGASSRNGSRDNLAALSGAYEELIRAEVQDTIQAFQKDFQTDGLGLEALYKKKWGNRPQSFTEFVVEPRVRVTVHGTGSII